MPRLGPSRFHEKVEPDDDQDHRHEVRLQRDGHKSDLQDEIREGHHHEDPGNDERRAPLWSQKENRDKTRRERSKEHRAGAVGRKTEQGGDHEAQAESDEHARRHEVDVRPRAAPPGRRERNAECNEKVRAGIWNPERREEEGSADREKDGAAKDTAA